MFRPICNRVYGLRRAIRPDMLSKNFWSWHRSPFGSIDRYVERRLWEMDREVNRAFEDMEHRFSPFRFPRWSGHQPWFWGRGPFSMCRESPIEVAEDGSRKVAIKVDVSHFKPEEVKVTVRDGLLTVQAKHEGSSKDGGKVSREYVREFTLPEDADQESLQSVLGNDGVLHIEAKLPAVEPIPPAKEIPILKSGDKPAREQSKN